MPEHPATNPTHEPFPLHSMRPAIEERFILDVLANDVTDAACGNLTRAA